MKVSIKLDESIKEPYAVIYTDEITKEIQSVSSYLKNGNKIITANEDESLVVLEKEKIYMVSADGRGTIIYDEKRQYKSKKKLYELEEILGKDFMRISKSTIINLKELERVDPYFNGMMIVLKNGCKDYISRKYLPELKKYLGL